MAHEKELDGAKQTEAQRRVLGEDGEAGASEPKSPNDWAQRGAQGGEPGRPPPVPGGASQGAGDRSQRSDGSRSDLDRRLSYGYGAECVGGKAISGWAGDRDPTRRAVVRSRRLGAVSNSSSWWCPASAPIPVW